MLISKFFDLLASKIRNNSPAEKSPVLPDLTADSTACRPVVPESVWQKAHGGARK